MQTRTYQFETFIIHIWKGSRPDEWRGTVEHIHSGFKIAFHNLTELKLFLENHSAIDLARDRPGLK